MRNEEKINKFHKYSQKKLMYGNNKICVKISLKLLTQNMNKELYIKILEKKLPKNSNGY